MEYARRYFDEVKKIADTIDLNTIEKMIQVLLEVRKKEIGKHKIIIWIFYQIKLTSWLMQQT